MDNNPFAPNLLVHLVDRCKHTLQLSRYIKTRRQCTNFIYEDGYCQVHHPYTLHGKKIKK